MYRLRQQAVAHQQKADVLLRGDDLFGRAHHELVALEVKQASYLADDHVLWAVAQLPAHLLAMLIRLEKRLDFHAAVDRGELFARGDAGRDEQIGHRVGHAHQRVTAAGGVAFAPAQDGLRPPALVRMKRRAVDRVHDGRHALRMGRRSAQQPRLAAVRVHDVGTKSCDRPPDLIVTLPVAQRMNLAPQRRKHFDRHAATLHALHQAAFGAQRRAGDEQHVVAVDPQEIFAREDRVFLSAAQNESRDKMNDPHAALI